MKKNIFKKIVASLATAAMAAGLFTAMPAEEAKAAADGKEKEIVLFVSGDAEFDHVLFDIDGQNASIKGKDAEVTGLGWGDMYEFKKDPSVENKYTITILGSVPDGEYCNMQFVFSTVEC